MSGAGMMQERYFRNMNTSLGKGCWCIIHNCYNKRGFSNVVFFSLPKEKARLESWLINCGREDLLNSKVGRGHVVCADHFDKTEFMDPFYKKLKPSAVPTIIPTAPQGSLAHRLSEAHVRKARGSDDFTTEYNSGEQITENQEETAETLVIEAAGCSTNSSELIQSAILPSEHDYCEVSTESQDHHVTAEATESITADIENSRTSCGIVEIQDDSSETSTVDKSWTPRREHILEREKGSISVAGAEALNAIAVCAAAKAKYYEEKLKMDREYHALRMQFQLKEMKWREEEHEAIMKKHTS